MLDTYSLHNEGPTDSVLTGLIDVLGEARLTGAEAEELLPIEITTRVLRSRPDDVLRLAHEKLHAFPFASVPAVWRRAYTEAARWKAISFLEGEQQRRKEQRDFKKIEDCRDQMRQNGEAFRAYAADGHQASNAGWIDEVVHALDMAVIMTGAQSSEDAGFKKAFRMLEQFLERSEACNELDTAQFEDGMSRSPGASENEPAQKRRKITSSTSKVPTRWSSQHLSHPVLTQPVQKVEALPVLKFQEHLNKGKAGVGPSPLHIKGAISHWPATDPSFINRNWGNPEYLLKRTLGGRRLVPVEIGKSYTDSDWGQKIISIREFVEQHMLDHTDALEPEPTHQTVYLAQHDIFAQIPKLREDICIPDYCYTTTPRRSQSDEHHHDNERGFEVDDDEEDSLETDPQLNAWFGPSGTTSPAHTDPHHNILAQVVGYKYVRLFPPSEDDRMYPRQSGEDGIDMTNTSEVDVGLAMKLLEGWDWGDDIRNADEETEFRQRFPMFERADYLEAVLGPGECLYIPRGWWHYVRGLSTSFSVSFWWD